GGDRRARRARLARERARAEGGRAPGRSAHRAATDRTDDRDIGSRPSARLAPLAAQEGAGRSRGRRRVPGGRRAPDDPEDSRVRARQQAQDGGAAQAVLENDLQQDQGIRPRALSGAGDAARRPRSRRRIPRWYKDALPAGVAEWQTQGTQNPPPARV